MTVNVKCFRRALTLSVLGLGLPFLNTLTPTSLSRPLLARADQEPVFTHFNYHVPVADLTIKADLYASDAQAAQHFKKQLVLSAKQAAIDWQSLVKRSALAHSQTTGLSESEHTLFQTLKDACQWSNGAFDASDYPLRKIWGFTPDSLAARLPTPTEIKAVLPQLGCQNLIVDKLPERLFLAHQNTRLNYDAFRRGWLIDTILPDLKKLSIPAFELKIDELAYYHGAPAGAKAWKIPWSHPRSPERTFTDLYAKDQALALIGDYQDFFMHNGIRYSSLLDSRDGYPNTKNLAIQVTAPSALTAEIIARTVALLDDLETKAFLAKIQHGTVYKIVEQNGIMYPVKY